MLTLNVYHVLDLLGCGGRTRYWARDTKKETSNEIFVRLDVLLIHYFFINIFIEWRPVTRCCHSLVCNLHWNFELRVQFCALHFSHVICFYLIIIIIPYVIKTWQYSYLCSGLSFKISGFKESNVYNAITISLLLPISLAYYQINYKVLIIINVWIM